MGSEFKIKSIIKPASENDVHAGWIRISEDLRHGIRNGEYVKIIANKRKIYCQVRGTPNETDKVLINEWYRELLGFKTMPDEVIELVISKVGFLGMIKAFQYHPDSIIRVSLGLGISSVGLGLIAVSFIGDITFAGDPVVFFVRIALVVFALFLFVGGFILFMGNPLSGKG